MKKTFEQITSDFYGYSIAKCQVHYDMAEKYKKIHRAFGTIVVIITTVVGTSIFTSLSGSTTSQLVEVTTAILSVAAVVLAALQTFLGFADLQAEHKTAGVGYAQVRRDLEMLVLKYPKGKGLSNSPEAVELELIKKLLDDLDKASPTISNQDWDRAWAKVAKKKMPAKKPSVLISLYRKAIRVMSSRLSKALKGEL